MERIGYEISEGIRCNIENYTWDYINSHVGGKVGSTIVYNNFLVKDNLADDITSNIHFSLKEDYEKHFNKR